MKYVHGIFRGLIIPICLLLMSCSRSSEVKIGVIIPQEGSLGDYGFQIISGIEMAEEQLRNQKAEGKLKKDYKIIYEHESADPTHPEVAVESFERLRKAGVVAVIGAASSSATIALAPLANEHQIILLSPASSSPEINDGGGDFVFRNYPSDTLEAQAISSVVFQRCFALKTLVCRSKNKYGEGIAFEFLRFARKNSEQIPNRVVKFDSDPSKVDFAKVVDEIVEIDPVAVFLAAYTDSLIPLIKEIKSRPELERLYIFTSSSLLVNKAVKALGPETVEGIMFAAYPWPLPEEANKPEILDFISRFQSKFGVRPDIYAAMGYDALMVLSRVLEVANTRLPHDIRAEMNKIVYDDSILGETDFNKRGDVTRIPSLYKIHDGAETSLTREDMDEIKTDILTRIDD